MELNTTRSPRRARCSHSQAREEAAAKAAEHRLARVTSSIELDRHSVQVSLVNGLLIASDGTSECTSECEYVIGSRSHSQSQLSEAEAARTKAEAQLEQSRRDATAEGRRLREQVRSR